MPGHEEIFAIYINRERIKQLKDHHKQRLMEILDGLKAGGLTAYMLASKIHWDVNACMVLLLRMFIIKK